MATPESLTSAEFSNALTDQNLQITRIVHAAVMVGPLIFLIVVLTFSFQQGLEPRPGSSEFELMNILTIVHGIFAVLGLLMVQFLSGLLFSPDRVKQGAESLTVEMLAAKCVTLQRSAGILRLAMLEGVSVFGLAVCFIGVINHVMQAEPAYWFNAASSGLFLIYAARLFPTRENLVEWFERAFSRG
jgi:hypothetical protein